MLAWGSKYLFGLSAGSFLAAMIYGIITGGEPIGALSVGYKGGYGILVSIGLAAFGAAVMMVVIHDGDSVEVPGQDVLPAVRPPSRSSYWGIISAFGAISLVIGVAISRAFFFVGIAVLAVAALEWCVLAWSDSATGDPEVNAIIRQRLVGPLELPLLSMIAIGVVVLGVSRVLLAVSSEGAVIVVAALAAIVFFGIVGLSRVEVPKSVMRGLAAVLALGILAGGIVGAAVGEHGSGSAGEETGAQE